MPNRNAARKISGLNLNPVFFDRTKKNKLFTVCHNCHNFRKTIQISVSLYHTKQNFRKLLVAYIKDDLLSCLYHLPDLQLSFTSLDTTKMERYESSADKPGLLIIVNGLEHDEVIIKLLMRPKNLDLEF